MYCSWGDHHVTVMHITNDNQTVGICEEHSAEVLHKIIGANRAKELPHLHTGEERRARPFPPIGPVNG